MGRRRRERRRPPDWAALSTILGDPDIWTFDVRPSGTSGPESSAGKPRAPLEGRRSKRHVSRFPHLTGLRPAMTLSRIRPRTRCAVARGTKKSGQWAVRAQARDKILSPTPPTAPQLRLRRNESRHPKPNSDPRKRNTFVRRECGKEAWQANSLAPRARSAQGRVTLCFDRQSRWVTNCDPATSSDTGRDMTRQAAPPPSAEGAVPARNSVRGRPRRISARQRTPY